MKGHKPGDSGGVEEGQEAKVCLADVEKRKGVCSQGVMQPRGARRADPGEHWALSSEGQKMVQRTRRAKSDRNNIHIISYKPLKKFEVDGLHNLPLNQKVSKLIC